MEPTVVRVGMYENPPKLYMSPTEKPTGIFPEIINYIARQENWKIEWVLGSWKESIKRLESGEIDIMPDVAFSLERAKKYVFSDEPVFLNWATLYSSSERTISSLIDLEGLRVAVMHGSIHTEGREGIKQQVANFRINCEFIEFSSYSEVFQAVHNGLADVGVVNRLFGIISSPSYDLSSSTVMFNPRHIKFAFPPGAQQTPILKKTIDLHLKKANTNPDSPIKKIISAFFNGEPIDLIFQKDGSNRIYFTEEEKKWIKDHPNIRLGVDPEFAPFEFINSDGQYSGFGADYIRILNQRLGINMQVVPQLSWQEVVDRAEKHEIDVLPAIGFTIDRSRYFKFTKPYIGFHRVIISNLNSTFISGLRDLSVLKVAVQANSSHAGWLQENSSLNLIEYDTLADSLLAVSEGEADVMVGNLAACTYLIRQLHITNLKVAAPLSTQRQLLHFAVRKDWPELVSILDKGLASISSQESEMIRNRWTAAGFNVGVPSEVMWKRIGAIFVTAIVFIGAFWAWSVKLKKEVGQRMIVEQELQEAQKLLEERVKHRTQDLEEANQALMNEMEKKLNLEQQLHRSQKMETIGLMAGGVAHDLNNILTSITSYPDLILMKLPQDSEIRPWIENIRFSGRQAGEVVSDLLTVARGSVGKREATELNNIILEYLNSPEHKKTIERHNKIEFETALDSGKTTILCSPVHIKKCLMNLIINAAEAIDGTGKVVISSRLLELKESNLTAGEFDNKDFVFISVKDSGPGIENKHINRIFEPFYSKKVMGKRSGSGLGLTVVWNTVHDHGGHIDVDSSKAGTTFSLYFPATNEPVAQDSPDVALDRMNGNGDKIIIVDDEEPQRFIISKLLEQLNYSVLTFPSGEEAAAHLLQNSADLVLLDMIMDPGLSGRETYEQIIECHPEQKVILLSGFGADNEVKKTIAMGANHFLKKPFTLQELGLAVKAVLAGKRSV